MEQLLVKKYDGTLVPFDQSRLLTSLKRSGATVHIAELITKAIVLESFDGITTKSIYRKASKLLTKHAKGTGVKYRLKQAMMDLGPSGYPFENFVAELFKQRGFEVEVGVMMQGWSVTHEVDVVAQNPDKYYVIECKFHNNQATKSDVKTPMYIHSRVQDLHKVLKKNDAKDKKTYKGWIVTNTRFTSEAIKFGEDYGLTMLSWDHPKEGGLRDWIEIDGLHPITSLSALSRKEKKALLKIGVVRCKQLLDKPEVMDELPIHGRNKRAALKEVIELFK